MLIVVHVSFDISCEMMRNMCNLLSHTYGADPCLQTLFNRATCVLHSHMHSSKYIQHTFAAVAVPGDMFAHEL
jgi:hypothetical protein